MLRLFLLILSLAVLACGERGSDDAPPAADRAHVRLALNWFPEAEHGGFYAAVVHGYYRQQGLDVEILGGGPDAPVIQRVATGNVDFGITNADDVLIARARQAPLVALMAPYQVNPRCIMVHAASGIERIEDITDITLALSPRPAFSHWLRRRFPFRGVRLVPYPGNVTEFLMDPRFAQQAYAFSEPFVARAQGAEPRSLLVADAGFNPYASVLVTTDSAVRDREAIVGAMVRASVAGWDHYLRAPEETNRYIHQLNPEMGLDILAFGAVESRPLVLDEVARQHGIGHMAAARWDTLLAQMIEAELIEPDAVHAERAYTGRFLR